MNIALSRFAGGAALAERALRGAGVIWFIAAAIGQLSFVYFILVYYGGRTLTGDFAGWNDRPIIDGHIEGDAAGNVMFALHVLLAAAVTLAGLVQLIPQVRARAPAAHRWTGRLFLTIAMFMAFGGLWLVWVRGTYLSVVSALSVSGNAVLIIGFGLLAWRRAAQRRIDQHRRWAMRAFMVVNGVWFFRVGIMAWMLLMQGRPGMNATLSGPADIVLSFGSYLIPLAALELYFVARDARSSALKALTAVAVLALTGVMSVGIFGTIAMMWGPYL